MLAAGPALANPAGGTVVAGSATITAPAPNTVAVQQQSNRAIIDWQSFSIGAGETTRFVQPSSSAFILNRVTGGDPSLIAGRLVANGNVAIVNGAGIMFLNGSVVDVNSLVATPADISNANFMAGRLNFDIPPANPNATVVNDGRISVKAHGLAALVAPGVQNNGVIQAKLGKVVLGGAETFTVDFYGDGLINFDVGSTLPAAAAQVENNGRIAADGGTILLSANAVDTIVSNVVTGGTLEARSVGPKTGAVEIQGGTATVNGTVDVSGAKAGETGGTVTVTGMNVAVGSAAAIDASGASGGGTVLIGGDFRGAGPLPNATDTTVAAGAVISADALENGNGGTIAVWSNEGTVFDGSISAKGAGNGSGGFVETSGGALTVAGTVVTSAPLGAMGTWLLDPATDLVIGSTLASTIDGAGSNVAVEATGSITVNANLAPQGSLGLFAGDNIVLDKNIDLAGAGDNLFLVATTGAITASGSATITLSGGTASLSAATGIGTSSTPIATVGLGTVAASTTSGGIFIANGTSGSVVAGSVAGFSFDPGSSPTTTSATDDSPSHTPVEEASGGTGANALIIETTDVTPLDSAVAFAALSGIAAGGDISLANAAGGITIDQAVDTTGSIALSASGFLDIEASVGASAAGTITLAADSGATGTGLLTVNGAVGNSSAGDIALSAATIAVTAAVAGGGALTLAPSTAGSSIALGDGASGTFALGSTSLGNLGSGGGIGAGFTGLTIGLAGGTGAITVNDGASPALAFAAPLTLESAGAGGTITIASAVTEAAGLALEAGGGAASTAISIAASVSATGDAGLVASNGNISIAGALAGANLYLSATKGAVTETAAGAVSASDLIVDAKNASALNTATNSISVLGADVTGAGFAFTNAGAFSVGAASASPPGMSPSQSGVTAGGDSALVALSGDLTVAAPITVGSANLLLDAAGAVSESGTATVTASGLLLRAGGDADLANANAVGTLAARYGGGFAFENGAALTVGAVSVAAPGITDSSTGIGDGTGTGDAALVVTSGALSLTDAVDAGTQNLLLESQTAAVSGAGAITANGLAIVMKGNETLSGAYAAIGASITGGGFSYTGSAPFQAGVTVSSPALGGTFGVTATNDIGLVASAGTLAIAQNVSGKNVYLSASAGAVTESGGAVSATDLIVDAAGSSALNAATNSVSVLAANVSGTGNGFAFTNAGAFSAGAASVSPPGLTVPAQNGVTAAGDVGLAALSGALTLSQNVSGANVALSAGGAVTESGGAVSATDLVVEAGSASALNSGSNDVAVLGANITGGFGFTEPGGFSAGAASVAAPGLSASESGVTATGDVGLVTTGGDLTLAESVSGANVLLSAASGAVTETAGAVSATDLIVEAANAAALNTATNSITLLAADVNAAGQGFGFTNQGSFSVGAASVTPAGIAKVTLSGVAASGDVGLASSSGGLTLASGVSGANVSLSAGDTVTESGGAVSATDLVVVSGGNAALNSATNSITVLGASSGGGFGFTNAGGFSLGAALAAPPGLSAAETGVTASGDVGLVASSQSLTLANGVSGANVYLSAAAAVTETTGAVSANDLVVKAGSASALNTATNSISVLGADVTGAGFAFTNAGAFSVGAASVAAPGLSASRSGVTAGGDSALVALSGDLTVAAPITVGSANLLLDAVGAVSESGTAAVTAGGLLLRAGGDADLANANAAGTLAARFGGGFAFENGAALTVGAVSVAAPGITDSSTGVGDGTGTGDAALVVTSGALSLTDGVDAGTHNLLLESQTAAVSGAGTITANGLAIVLSGSDETLSGAYAAIGASITGGGFSYTGSAPFQAGVTVSSPALGGTFGVSATNDVALLANGSIALKRAIDAGGSAFIEADGTGAAITAAGGTIGLSGGSLSLVANAGIGTAGAPVRVTDSAALTLAGTTETGGFYLSASSPAASGAAVTIGAVTPPAPLTTPVTGVTVASSGDVALQNAGGTASGGSIVLTDGISAAGNVFLEADGSGAGIATTGGEISLSGGSLSLVASSAVGTASAPIRVMDENALTLAGAAGVGGWYVSVASPGFFGEAVTVGGVSPPGFFAAAPSGVTDTAGGSVALQNAGGFFTGGSIVLADGISATTGSVFLEADGSGAQITASGGAITLSGGGLSLVANAGVGAAAAPVEVTDGSPLTLAGATQTGGWYIATDAAATVGALAPPAFFATSATGVTDSISGDIALQAAGTITLANNVVGAGNVFLESENGIGTSGAVIELASGSGLSLVAGAGVGTADAPVRVSDAGALTVAGASASGGWYVSVSSPASSAGAVTVGALTPPSYFNTTPVTGITAGGDMALQSAAGAESGGSIVLADSIDASGNVFLETAPPASQIVASGGVITLSGSKLFLSAVAGVGSASAPVDVVDGSTLTIAGGSATGGWYVNASAGLTIGSMTLPSLFGAGASASGITEDSSGDIAVRTGGAISLVDTIAAQGSVYLEADGAGATIAEAGGVIRSAGGALSLVASRGVGTPGAPIEVAASSPLTIAGATGNGGWYVSVVGPAVTFGTVTPPPYFATTPIAGVTIATSGDFALQNPAGSIAIASDINLSGDPGGNVYLEADGSGTTIGESGGTIRLDGSNLSLIAASGIGTSAAPIAITDSGPLTVAASTSSGGIFLSDASPSLTVGQVATPGFFATPLVSGLGTGGEVSLANSGGTITEAGATINANLLAVAASGTVSLTGTNAIANLGAVTITGKGDFVLQDTGSLALVGNVSDLGGAISIATDGFITVPDSITYGAAGHIALGSAGFEESGTFAIAETPAVIIDATGLSAADLAAITVTSSNQVSSLPLGTGTGANPKIMFGGDLSAPGSQLLISADGASVTGTIEVAGLGVSGFNDTIDLYGSISGIANQFAAILAIRAQGPDNSDRFNACAIGSPSCFVQPTVTPIIPPSLNDVDFLALPAPLDPLDIDRLNTGNEDDL